MKKIIGIGNALLDIMTMLKDDSIISELGFPKGSMTLVNKEDSLRIRELTSGLKRERAAGGSVANTIHGLGMLGAAPAYIGSIGPDETGDIFETDMQVAGVETYLVRKKSVTGTAVALVSPDSERTFATHLGAAIELKASDIEERYIKGSDILYLEGYLIIDPDLVNRVCHSAKEFGLKIAIDLASFNVVDQYRDNFTGLIKRYVDIIFANKEEAEAFTGLEGDDALKRMSEISETAVMKLGKNGSKVLSGGEIISTKAYKSDVVDTTGAGDLFASGFLYGLCSGESIETCCKFGNLLASKVIGVIGPKMSNDTWNIIKSEMAAITS